MLATRTVGQRTSTDTGALEDTVLFGIMPGTDASFCQFWKLEAQNKVLVGSCDLLQGQTLSMPFSQLQVCQQSWHLQLHNASLPPRPHGPGPGPVCLPSPVPSDKKTTHTRLTYSRKITS